MARRKRGKRLEGLREGGTGTPVGGLGSGGGMSVPRFASSPVVGRGGLTPAGRRLLGRVVATPKLGESSGLKSGLKEGWTPRVERGEKAEGS